MPKEELEQLAVEDGVLAFFEGVKKYFEAMVTGTLAFKVSGVRTIFGPNVERC